MNITYNIHGNEKKEKKNRMMVISGLFIPITSSGLFSNIFDTYENIEWWQMAKNDWILNTFLCLLIFSCDYQNMLINEWKWFGRFRLHTSVKMIWFVANFFNILFVRVQIHVSSWWKKIFDDPRIISTWIYGKKVKHFLKLGLHFILATILYRVFIEVIHRWYFENRTTFNHFHSTHTCIVWAPKCHCYLTRSPYQAFVFHFCSFLPCEYINRMDLLNRKLENIIHSIQYESSRAHFH